MSTTPAQTVSAADALALDTELVSRMLTRFLANETRKIGFDRLIIGVSGGVDSAVAAALACRAVGAENVIAVIMPYRSSSEASERDARTVCRHLGVDPLVVDITPQIDGYFERFPDAGRDRRGNKMARERMTVLYDLSLAHRALVVGTSNKTEQLLGYGTVFGDMAHALNPLGDLYKTQVFALARSLAVPIEVIEKAPSADLWEGQSDEDDLGFRYAIADLLLHYMVDQRRSRAELRALGYGDAFVDDLGRRIRSSQYKRCLPIIAKLGSRTLGRDFRYPRDWGA